MRFLISLISLFVFSAEANEFKFPFYNYEKLVQIDAKECRLDIKNQKVVAEKHYEADIKILAMEWLGKQPGLDDAQGVYKNLPGLALQNNIRLRDMYVLEKLSHEILTREKELIKKLGGDAAGNNWNRLEAKSSMIVVYKLKTSLTRLEEMERTLLKILGHQSSKVNSRSKEGDSSEKGKYSKEFKEGLYEATYASDEYERIHNKSCMWSPDRMIKKSEPYCGYVWSHAGNFYLERCPGDVHPFGKGHARGAKVNTVAEIFNFKAVDSCSKAPSCQKKCFKHCLEKGRFNTEKEEKLVNGVCKAMADPLYPKDMKERTIVNQYLVDFNSFPEYYPKFGYNNRDQVDVGKEANRYYEMTGKYKKEDCRSGKREFLLEQLDAVKQLISLQNNLVEYYTTASNCYIKLAEKIEEAAGVGVKHYVRDGVLADKGDQANGLMAIEKDGKKGKVRPMTKEEQEEADASFFGLTGAEQDKLLEELISSDYKFTENHMGLICTRSMRKDFCGGRKKDRK